MYCTIPDDGECMKVKIKGKIRIKDDKGNVIFEHDNNILFQTLTQVLAYLLTASLPNSTPSSNDIIYLGNNTITASVSVSGNEIVFSGSFSPTSTQYITVEYLFVNFHYGSNTYGVLVAETSIPFVINPGTYTVEWIWYIDDSIGIVFNLLSNSLQNTLSSVSVSYTPSPKSSNIFSTQQTVTFLLFYFNSSSVNITSVTISVTINSTAISWNISLNTLLNGIAETVIASIQIY